MKRLGKILSLAIAVLMLVSVFSVGAFAFSNDYVTVDCPENYDVEDLSESGSDEFWVNLWYDEWYTAEDGNEYYTGNTVDLYISVALEEQALEDYDYGDEYFEQFEWFINGTKNSTEIKYENIGGYEALVYDMYYTYEDYESNLRVTDECLYSEVYIITNNCVVDMYIDVVDAEDLVAFRNETVETFMGSISYNEAAILQNQEEQNTLVTIIGAVVLGVLAFIVIVIVVIIVVAVKSSKKKKAQRMAQQQQYNPYGYNPNGQYTPYSQPPVNNGQYNPYGQQPPVNNNQYTPYNLQSNAYTPYAPAQKQVSETKDPLDLDNKE